MIIQSSIVGMQSERKYYSYSSTKSAAVVSKNPIQLSVGVEGKSLMQQLEESQNKKLKNNEDATKQRNKEMLRNLMNETKKAKETGPEMEIKTEEDMKLELLRKILESLRGYKCTKDNSCAQKVKLYSERVKQLKQDITQLSTQVQAQSAGSAVLTTGSTWTRTMVTSSFFLETEHVAYTTTGNVKTADGKNISFNISLEMSRAFCEENESFTQETYITVDPLVINLDAATASVTDQKFLFDLDTDGVKEEISFAGEGSGFLALDKNNDGIINDGSELFGTKSGDGFADLAKYDEDGNGWIDEADDVFNNLKVWTKDAQGKDQLISIRKAGVGAIYLGSADTEYHLNDMETNETNAVIRKTGFYLKEDGGAGTIQHVDLAL